MSVLSPNLTHELTCLGENIKLARKRRKITLEDMAIRTESSVSTLSRLESGESKVALGTLLKVLEVLGLLKGISDFLSPGSDSAQTLEEVRNIRLGKMNQKKKFESSELDF